MACAGITLHDVSQAAPHLQGRGKNPTVGVARLWERLNAQTKQRMETYMLGSRQEIQALKRKSWIRNFDDKTP